MDHRSTRFSGSLKSIRATSTTSNAVWTVDPSNNKSVGGTDAAWTASATNGKLTLPAGLTLAELQSQMSKLSAN